MIKKIDSKKSESIIANYAPEGLFWYFDYASQKYIGIDNSTGDAWVEEFDTLEDCKQWLESKDE